jgi:hypothetical protein
MNKELKNFANFVFGELLDLYTMKDWGCDFEAFKSVAYKAILEEGPRWKIEEEDV